MRKISLILITAVLGITTACSDAPTSGLSPRSTSPLHTTGVSTTVGDTTFTTFTIDPTATDMYVEAGVFKLRLVANSVCDPSVTAYGPAEWDNACTTLTQSLTITSKSYTNAAGHPVVKFTPDLRFAPGKVNTLYLWDKNAAAGGTATPITWCPTGSTSCVDESLTDPSVATTLGANGFLSRRVKHFSGYTVTADINGGGDPGY
jgi:hypothetical protein